MSAETAGAPVPSFEQIVETGQLVSVLRVLAGFQGTGLLAVQGEDDLVSLTFRNGDIVAADAMNRSADEGLCEVLAQRGLLPPREFREIVEQEDGTVIGSERLLRSGRIEKHLLLDAVREQIFRQSLQLLRWPDGHLQWVEGGDSPYQKGVVPLGVGELLLRSLEELGAAGPLGTQEPDFVCDYKIAGSLEGRFRLWKPGDGFDELDESAATQLLTPAEVSTLKKVQEGIGTQELIPEAMRQSWRVRAALHVLWLTGLVQRHFRESGAIVRLQDLGNPAATSLGDPLADFDSSAPQRDSTGDRSSLRENSGDSASLLSLGSDPDLAALLEDPPSLRALAGKGEQEPATASLESRLPDVPLDDGPLDEALSGDVLSLDDSLTGDKPHEARSEGRSAYPSGPVSPGPLQDALLREHSSGDHVIPDLGFEDLYSSSTASLEDRRPKREHLAGLVETWGVRFIAAVLLALLIRQVVGVRAELRPSYLFTDLAALETSTGRVAWQLTEDKLSHSLRVYHLLYGVYPDDLSVLMDLDLCSAHDLAGPGGDTISYQIEDDGYRLARRTSNAFEGSEWRRETPVGDFLLNPQYIRQPGESTARPIVVLD